MKEMTITDFIAGLVVIGLIFITFPIFLMLELVATIHPFSIGFLQFGKPPKSCPGCGGRLKLHGYGEYSGHKLTCYNKKCKGYELDGVETYEN